VTAHDGKAFGGVGPLAASLAANEAHYCQLLHTSEQYLGRSAP
jgi:hypothetical protein